MKSWSRCGVEIRSLALFLVFLSTSIIFMAVLHYGSTVKGIVMTGKYWPRMPMNNPMPFARSNLSPAPRNWHNLLVLESSNYTSTLMESIRLNATSSSPCHTETTNFTKLEGLPVANAHGHQRYVLKTDTVYQLTLVAFDTNGKKRCAGGDYFEVDLHDKDSAHYRSRLLTLDFGNGSYGLELVVPSRFAGQFNLEIWLLFGNWHGMDRDPGPWVKQTLILSQELELSFDLRTLDSADGVPADFKSKYPFLDTHLTQCTQRDFERTAWQGRWTRLWRNESCEPDDEKRFRCVPQEHASCEESWCFGSVAGLESNGWHYSAHCGFKIFQPEEAWDCLNGRWFLMWGDSNHQDTIRNLIAFVLKWNSVPPMKKPFDLPIERTCESDFVNQERLDQTFRVSSVFNGANKIEDNYEGLHTLQHEEHQAQLLAHFSGATWPDTIIMNSGLHDLWKKIENYSEMADFVIEWWTNLYLSIRADRRPQLIWRTTVAPAGFSRQMEANPNKMEMFNSVIVEKLQRVRDKLPVKFVDAFDLTFPFHYDNNCSDGGHYGRVPGSAGSPWYGRPHWYFVDIMLDHILLNAVCNT